MSHKVHNIGDSLVANVIRVAETSFEVKLLESLDVPTAVAAHVFSFLLEKILRLYLFNISMMMVFLAGDFLAVSILFFAIV